MASLSTYEFSTVYTTLPHYLIQENIDLIGRTFQREGSHNHACNERNAFFTSEEHKKYTNCTHYGHVKRCVKLSLFFYNIRFGTYTDRSAYAKVHGSISAWMHCNLPPI